MLVVLAFPPWSAGKSASALSDKSNTPFKCVTQLSADFRLNQEAVCGQWRDNSNIPILNNTDVPAD